MAARLTMLCVGTLFAAISLAGCGGDGDGGDSTTVTTSSLSKAEFIRRADAICFKQQGEMGGEIRDFEVSRTGNPTPLNLSPEAVTTIVLPRMEAQVEELQRLGAPKGDEAEIESFLSALSLALDNIEAQELSSSAELSRAFEAEGELGRQYGFQACAYG